jgi:pimeloyl-ACP methyl ester carboxylesterase
MLRSRPSRRVAATQLSYLHPAGHGEQGAVRDAQRSALNGLAKLRWFAPFGMAFAGRFVATSLRQVTRYLTEDDIREAVQQRVAAHLDTDTCVLIGHSLGSVVAYEAAHRLTQPLRLLITLGSPLGLRTVVYDRVIPQPPGYPSQVRRWVNIADRNDLIAAHPDLRPMFGPLPPEAVFDGGWTVHNGAKPHQAEFYLTKEQTGRLIADALNARQHML